MGEPKADNAAADGQSFRIVRRPDGLTLVSFNTESPGTDPAKLLAKLDEALVGAAAGNSLQIECDCAGSPNPVLVAVLLQSLRNIHRRNLEADLSGLPESIRKLLDLAIAVPAHRPADVRKEYFVGSIGRKTIDVVLDSFHFVQFLGELTYSFGRLLIGRARFRIRDFWVTLQECGISALPIVGLLALLTGIILAFIGAIQLQKFGATIYVTDLVGLAMSREMACIMTGVIMSGRTGAAFAAQIGSMNVNQEVDALETLGLSPVEFLVLPRALALIMMMPLLTLYADVIGWFGGFIVAVPMNINAAEYWLQLKESLTLNHILFGLSKSFFFGVIVAASGCYYGLRSGRNSAAVGEAATKAVVAGITWIVVVDALFAFIDEIIT